MSDYSHYFPANGYHISIFSPQHYCIVHGCYSREPHDTIVHIYNAFQKDCDRVFPNFMRCLPTWINTCVNLYLILVCSCCMSLTVDIYMQKRITMPSTHTDSHGCAVDLECRFSCSSCKPAFIRFNHKQVESPPLFSSSRWVPLFRENNLPRWKEYLIQTPCTQLSM